MQIGTQQLAGFVARGEISGLVALTFRHGELVQEITLGARDLEAGAPMERDTIFRIASMTKPITSVAVIMLVEEGKLRLDDPVGKWIPELANPKVLRDPKGRTSDTVPASRAITVEDLMTHRSGITYGFLSEGPLAEAMGEILGDGLDNEKSPDEWLAALGALPLVSQPGEKMTYGHSTDVLGFLLARIESKPFAQVLQDRILGPLKMRDTTFHVGPGQRDRLAKMYRYDEARGALSEVAMPSYEKHLSYTSGGGGLISTAGDYLTFARMLLNKGSIDGVQLLKRETVADMCSNRLTPDQRKGTLAGAPIWRGMGFGLGLAVVDDPRRNLQGCGRAGAFGWPGIYGTWWQVDPAEDLVTIFLSQHMLPLSAGGQAVTADARGLAGRMALSAYQKAVYATL
ncbi:MAG TPA: serine hydrolase domain-containing protein [Rhizomicrobium sp.]|nr:serine hydrolase domain-containing protein [Rhizomicrobium sp.]